MNYLDASTASDLCPVAAALRGIQTRAIDLGIDIMVVGATARDILLQHHVGLTPERATADVDVAIAVSGWEDFDALTGPLDNPSKRSHEFRVGDMTVDIIPFGGVENADRTILWPDEHRMNVLGFAEAMASAVHVALPLQIEVAVASLPAQSLLKLIAWRDRRFIGRKDAVDLRTILLAYHRGPYHDALYDDHFDLLEKRDFVPDTAGAERIGSDAAALVGEADRAVVRDTLLLRDDLMGALAGDMGGGRIADNRSLLEAYRDGFAMAAGS